MMFTNNQRQIQLSAPRATSGFYKCESKLPMPLQCTPTIAAASQPPRTPNHPTPRPLCNPLRVRVCLLYRRCFLRTPYSVLGTHYSALPSLALALGIGCNVMSAEDRTDLRFGPQKFIRGRLRGVRKHSLPARECPECRVGSTEYGVPSTECGTCRGGDGGVNEDWKGWGSSRGSERMWPPRL